MIPFIAGNWKMHGMKASASELVLALGEALPRGTRHCDIALFPPATLLCHIENICKENGFGLGGQDCHFEPAGAFTGDISPVMLKDAGCQYVLLGHSERRTLHEESSVTVRKKAAAALEAGLIPIICVGETLEQQENGQTLMILQEQLVASLPRNAISERMIIAYEPVWAIGTGKTPTPEGIAHIHRFIHEFLVNQFEKPFRILYGGSVKAANAKALLAIPYVNGLLVGGASLDKKAFIEIIQHTKNPAIAY